jgi:hypothetical protein
MTTGRVVVGCACRLPAGQANANRQGLQPRSKDDQERKNKQAYRRATASRSNLHCDDR